MKFGLTGKVSDTVRCGYVDWRGNLLSGCGKLTETLESVDRVPGYKGLYTTSYFCAACRASKRDKYPREVPHAKG